jgi:aspartate kinase
MAHPRLSSVTFHLDEARLLVNGFGGGLHAVSSLFDRISHAEIPIDMISRTTSCGGCADLSFTVPAHYSSRAWELTREAAAHFGAMGATVDLNVAKVSLSGIGLRFDPDLTSLLCRILASEGIAIGMISTSDTRISLLVPRSSGVESAEVIARHLLDVSHPALINS